MVSKLTEIIVLNRVEESVDRVVTKENEKTVSDGVGGVAGSCQGFGWVFGKNWVPFPGPGIQHPELVRYRVLNHTTEHIKVVLKRTKIEISDSDELMN